MINTMIANESGYICTDIKFGNILVNYVADENKNILEISKIVLHDFDNYYCHKKTDHIKLHARYNNPEHISRIYKIFKCIVLLSLILSQIRSIMSDKKKYIAEMFYMTREYNHKYLFNDVNILMKIKETIIKENIYFIYMSNILKININLLFTPLYYIFFYSNTICTNFIKFKKDNSDTDATEKLIKRKNIDLLIDDLKNVIDYVLP